MMINKADLNNFIVRVPPLLSEQTRFLKSRKENSIHWAKLVLNTSKHQALSARRESTRETWLLQRTSAASLQRPRTEKLMYRDPNCLYL
jgi:hypothetical protein